MACFDTNVLMEIARHSDASTAIAMMKTFALFGSSKDMGHVVNIDPQHISRYSVFVSLPGDDTSEKIIQDLRDITGVSLSYMVLFGATVCILCAEDHEAFNRVYNRVTQSPPATRTTIKVTLQLKDAYVHWHERAFEQLKKDTAHVKAVIFQMGATCVRLSPTAFFPMSGQIVINHNT